MSDIEIENQTGADIIDATQNAVIEAVSNVSQIIEKTSEDAGGIDNRPSEMFYASAEFWVGAAFVLVVIVLGRPLFGAVKKLLNKRRDNIIAEIDEAANLQFSAQELLARYERQFLNTQKEINEIVQSTSKELEAYTDHQKKLLENDLMQAQKKARQKIDETIEKTRAEISKNIAEKTMKIVFQNLNQNFKDAQKSKMIDESIKNILDVL